MLSRELIEDRKKIYKEAVDTLTEMHGEKPTVEHAILYMMVMLDEETDGVIELLEKLETRNKPSGKVKILSSDNKEPFTFPEIKFPKLKNPFGGLTWQKPWKKEQENTQTASSQSTPQS